MGRCYYNGLICYRVLSDKIVTEGVGCGTWRVASGGEGRLMIRQSRVARNDETTVKLCNTTPSPSIHCIHRRDNLNTSQF
jgi:hypothetical protein